MLGKNNVAQIIYQAVVLATFVSDAFLKDLPAML